MKRMYTVRNTFGSARRRECIPERRDGFQRVGARVEERLTSRSCWVYNGINGNRTLRFS